MLSRELKKSPAIISVELLSDLQDIELIKSVTEENGYINIFLNNDIFTTNFKTIYNNYLNDKNYFNV
ncbi:hypothetical protein GW891_03095 [bacterium]|nr:hypothetical protein [bacterium]